MSNAQKSNASEQSSRNALMELARLLARQAARECLETRALSTHTKNKKRSKETRP